MIKKIILMCSIVVVLVGCSIKEEDTTKTTEKKEIIEVNQEKDYVQPYVDDNPIELGLYINNGGSRSLVTSYDSPMNQYTDIVSLEVYYTKDSSFNGNQKVLWNGYYQKYQNIDKYKIGYYISFEVGNEKISKIILKPSDGDSIFNYIQVYLYDDINQGDGYYDHITDSEITDSSILSSIKLTASTDIGKISSPVKIMAFTYDNEDDFDDNGLYRGNSYYEVTINRK